MNSNLSLSGMGSSDMSILFVLLAVIILLALLAAVGAWARGGGIKRADAESLFSETQDRQREEISRLEQLIEETRKSNLEAHSKAQEHISGHVTGQLQDVSSHVQGVSSRMNDIDQQVARARNSIEAAVAQASADHSEALSDELELLTRRLGETERKLAVGFEGINASLGQLQVQVSQAGDQLKSALMEISKQQQDQKAHSTIQMCEALITSLGTLKSSIVTQLEQDRIDHTARPEPAKTDFEVVHPSADTRVEQPAAGAEPGISEESLAASVADRDHSDIPLSDADKAARDAETGKWPRESEPSAAGFSISDGEGAPSTEPEDVFQSDADASGADAKLDDPESDEKPSYS